MGIVKIREMMYLCNPKMNVGDAERTSTRFRLDIWQD